MVSSAEDEWEAALLARMGFGYFWAVVETGRVGHEAAVIHES